MSKFCVSSSAFFKKFKVEAPAPIRTTRSFRFVPYGSSRIPYPYSSLSGGGSPSWGELKDKFWFAVPLTRFSGSIVSVMEDEDWRGPLENNLLDSPGQREDQTGDGRG